MIYGALIGGAVGIIVAMLTFVYGVSCGAKCSRDIADWRNEILKTGYDGGYSAGYQEAKDEENQATSEEEE